MSNLSSALPEVGLSWLDPDVLVGGWPCQGNSVAGKRKGHADKRSGLFTELAGVIRLLKPRWIVLENVPGLLSVNKGADMAEVVATLSEIGYCLSWRVLDSRYFGVAQRRRRVFIVGSLGSRGSIEVLFESKSLRGHPKKGGKAGCEVASTIGASFAKHHGASAGKDSLPRNSIVSRSINAHGQRQDGESESFIVYEENQRSELRETNIGEKVDPARVREASRISRRLDDTPDSPRYKALGNAVTVDVIRWIARRIKNYEETTLSKSNQRARV